MIQDSRPDPHTESPTALDASPSPGLVSVILAVGLLAGLAAGWILFASPLSSLYKPQVLYDEGLVTSIYERANKAVVVINVVPRTRSPFSIVPEVESGSGFLVDDAGHIVEITPRGLR